MAGGVTRRAALAGAAGLFLARQAVAQDFRLVAVTPELISTADGSFGITSPAKPNGDGPFPLVIVLAGEGESAVTVDALDRLTRAGIFAVASDVFSSSATDSIVMQRIDATRDWASKRGGDTSRFGIVGFGSGGRAAWLYDAYSPTLKAAVSWYGPMQGATTPAQPMTALDAASHLHAPLLGLYGKNDGTPQRLLLDAESKAKHAGKTAEIVAYVGAGPNFAVPGTPSFDQAATLDGWDRTLKWLRANGVH